MQDRQQPQQEEEEKEQQQQQQQYLYFHIIDNERLQTWALHESTKQQQQQTQETKRSHKSARKLDEATNKIYNNSNHKNVQLTQASKIYTCVSVNTIDKSTCVC